MSSDNEKACPSGKDGRSSIVPPKPRRPLTEYHIFFQLERNYIVQDELGGTSHSEDSPIILDEDAPARPKKYRNTIMPKDWLVSGKKDTKMRKDRTKHGIISFIGLSKTVANSWKSADTETRMYCKDLANERLALYKEEMDAYVERYGEDAVKAQGKKRKIQPVKDKNNNVHKDKDMPVVINSIGKARLLSNCIGKQGECAVKAQGGKRKARRVSKDDNIPEPEDDPIAHKDKVFVTSETRLHGNGDCSSTHTSPMLPTFAESVRFPSMYPQSLAPARSDAVEGFGTMSSMGFPYNEPISSYEWFLPGAGREEWRNHQNFHDDASELDIHDDDIMELWRKCKAD